MEPSQLSEDQALGMVVAGACCCLVAVAGFIALFIWWMRRASQTPAGAAAPAPVSAPVGAPATSPQPAAPQMHLSVLAVAFDVSFRGPLEAALGAPSTATDAVTERVQLVHRACRALLGIEPGWRAFGYGEKDLGDLTQAHESYLRAMEDFRVRCAGTSDGGPLAMLMLIVATRTPLLGVDRLDERAQVRSVLEDRWRVEAAHLLGADVLWTPDVGGLTEGALLERFPEMNLLKR
ncbi:MAG: DUF1517 domain-containing protein [Myxococcota bacterium]|jgi:hypothetical protein